MAALGPRVGYFTRHGTDHHSFVIFPRRVMNALAGVPLTSDVTTNQITWQAGSLREVVDGHAWFQSRGGRIHRAGRDLPGSNWHFYPFDPDGHINELYYGIEQIGWDGLSKPHAMHAIKYREPPALPHISEQAELLRARGERIDLGAGYRDGDCDGETFDVGGVLLARPFKIVRVGPVRLFVNDMAAVVSFYRDELGLEVTEEVIWRGHRAVFLRANTEHHSIALYPKAIRAELGLNSATSLFSFGMQVGDYQQLKDAVNFLKNQNLTIRYLPPELFPGVDYSAFAIDPDGHAIQLYYRMEQVGWDGKPCPAASRPVIDNEHWPETVPLQAGTFLGEPYLGPFN